MGVHMIATATMQFDPKMIARATAHLLAVAFADQRTVILG